MDGENISTEVQVEVGESRDGEVQKLDDATNEPQSFVEQNGDYQQAEAIQETLAIVVNESQQAVDLPMPCCPPGDLPDGSATLGGDEEDGSIEVVDLTDIPDSAELEAGVELQEKTESDGEDEMVDASQLEYEPGHPPEPPDLDHNIPPGEQVAFEEDNSVMGRMPKMCEDLGDIELAGSDEGDREEDIPIIPPAPQAAEMEAGSFEGEKSSAGLSGAGEEQPVNAAHRAKANQILDFEKPDVRQEKQKPGSALPGSNLKNDIKMDDNLNGLDGSIPGIEADPFGQDINGSNMPGSKRPGGFDGGDNDTSLNGIFKTGGDFMNGGVGQKGEDPGTMGGGPGSLNPRFNSDLAANGGKNEWSLKTYSRLFHNGTNESGSNKGSCKGTAIRIGHLIETGSNCFKISIGKVKCKDGKTSYKISTYGKCRPKINIIKTKKEKVHYMPKGDGNDGKIYLTGPQDVDKDKAFGTTVTDPVSAHDVGYGGKLNSNKNPALVTDPPDENGGGSNGGALKPGAELITDPADGAAGKTANTGKANKK